jgi:ABC-2 type transport system ATP-binding protein
MSAPETILPARAPVAIRAQSLYKGYGLQLAVDGLSLEVPRGSFFGFLGANGAGKSTTIRMLTGLIPPDSGTIEILGFQMPKDELEIKRRIGLVPDESMLFDRLTGMEFLEFAGRMYGLARSTAIDRARDLMNLFELADDGKIIGEYSKGMRKRVAMAASLIHHPELFLMDEPFEGVDAVGARLMKDILLDQVRRGATIFLTSHVLEVVERLCDRVAIIDHGRIVTCGSMEELRAGGESLEDAFVRIVGAEHHRERLGWL